MVDESIVREAEQALHDARAELSAGLGAIVESTDTTEGEVVELIDEIERLQTLVDRQGRRHNDDPDPEVV